MVLAVVANISALIRAAGAAGFAAPIKDGIKCGALVHGMP